MTLVAAASAVVAALIDSGPDGAWADDLLGEQPLVAPHLMPVETASILRRAVAVGEVSADAAALAYGDLLELRIQLYAFEPFASRVWELRESLTAYDAWYVALAEHLDVPLATLDLRLCSAPGPRCEFAVPA